ncbi:response regulator [Ectothiorhodospiraceae bacterium WFHF3C12]|nr:response regulator [Ectothiorhodospiraceae bacterium WFHF3C12]
MSELQPIPILMAEDDPEDRLLTREAFREGRLANPLFFVEDGEALMDYLRRRGSYADEALYPFPGVVLLDLNMPRKDGRTCLAEIKRDPGLRHLPVVVLTTSAQEEEVVRSYDLGANSFVSKPVDFNKLVGIVQTFGCYWFSIVELPDAP